MDTYITISPFKCIRCYKCVYLSMNKHDTGLGCFTIEYQGAPGYYNDYVGCHHCSLPVNKDGEYDESCESVSYPCEKVCPSKALEIERW